jgi:hypothetical protein
MNEGEAKRKALEEEARARTNFERHDSLGFHYRPTPPSGPAPKRDDTSAAKRARRKQRD